MKAIENIRKKLNRLSPDLIEILDHYLDTLVGEKSLKEGKKLTQDWAGGLKNEAYNSTELQKKALNWREK